MTPTDELLSIAPPPKKAIGTGTGQEWALFERHWKLEFPEDFKWLIKTYGSGRFADFFGIAAPFYISKGDISHEEYVNLRLGGVRYAQTAMPKYAASFPTHPAAGGLFPFGYTDNGGTLFWLTEGENNQWPIVCMDNAYSKDFNLYRLTLVSFLTKWLRNEIHVVTTPESLFPFRGQVFRSH